MTHQITINLTPGSTGSAVFIDGQEIRNLSAIDIRAGVGEPTRVTLTLVGIHVELRGDVDTVARQFGSHLTIRPPVADGSA
jgi:hypothetical protein